MPAFPPVSTAVEAFHYRARHSPDRLAYAIEGESIGYGALGEQAIVTATNLADRGLGRGERCALVLPTGVDCIRALYAVQLAGATPVVLNSSLAAPVLLRRIRALRCRLVITASGAIDESLRGAVEAAPDDASPVAVVDVRVLPTSGAATSRALPLVTADDIAYIQVTSGTTGEPRGVMISHRSLTASQRNAHAYLAITPDDVFASWLPLHHDLGLVRFVFAPLYFGVPGHLLQPSILNLTEWLQTMSRVRATITASPDFGYRVAARSVDARGLDLSALRLAINGGEPVRLSTIESFERRFGVSSVVRPGYGLAEVTLTVSVVRPGEALRCDASGNVSCGRAVPGVEIGIVDADNRRLGPGERGEILVRGETVFDGYFAAPDDTARALDGGWLHTGDEGVVDADGHLYVLGRRRNMIKTAGSTVAPRETEEACDAAAAVRLSAAIGVADPAGTDAVMIVAEVRPELAITHEVRADIAREISGRVQRAIGFRRGASCSSRRGSSRSPRTGKSCIRSCVAASNRPPSTPMPSSTSGESSRIAPRSALEAELLAVWGYVLDDDRLGVTDDFFDAGGDSLAVLTLLEEIERHLGCALPLSSILEASTIERQAELVRADGARTVSRPLVAFERAGTRLPIAFTAPAGGHVLSYRALASYLGPGRPIYALQAQGLDGTSPVLTSVEAMARQHVLDLHAGHLSRVWMLAGYSFGGLVAYEMAQQLTRAGVAVPLLVLLDTHRPTAWRFVRRHVVRAAALGPRAGLAYLAGQARGRFRKSAATRRRDVDARRGRPARLTGRLAEMEEIADEAARRYRPEIYTGRVMIVEGEHPCASLWRDRVTMPIERHRVACAHDALLTEPHVRTVGALMTAALASVEPA